jgi:hypothetical protein
LRQRQPTLPNCGSILSATRTKLWYLSSPITVQQVPQTSLSGTQKDGTQAHLLPKRFTRSSKDGRSRSTGNRSGRRKNSEGIHSTIKISWSCRSSNQVRFLGGSVPRNAGDTRRYKPPPVPSLTRKTLQYLNSRKTLPKFLHKTETSNLATRSTKILRTYKLNLTRRLGCLTLSLSPFQVCSRSAPRETGNPVPPKSSQSQLVGKPPENPHIGRAIWEPKPRSILVTDSSMEGWGSVLHTPQSMNYMHSNADLPQSQKESPQSVPTRGFHARRCRAPVINQRELLAAIIGLRSFLNVARNSHVFLNFDSQVALAVTRNWTSKSPQIMALLYILRQLCEDNGISLGLQYLPSILNTWADRLSRQCDKSDWALTPNAAAQVLTFIQVQITSQVYARREPVLPQCLV